MITEELLEQGLHATADRYDVPAGAVDRLRDRMAAPAPGSPLTPRSALPRTGWRPSSGFAWIAAGVCVLALAVGLPLALGGGPTNHALAAYPALGSAPSGSGNESATPAHRNASRGAETTNAGSGSAGGSGVPEPAPTSVGTAGDGASGSSAGAPASGTGTVPSLEDRVVKTGTLDLQVVPGQVAPTLQRLAALATGVGGFVEKSTSSTAGPAPSGELTLRVPVGAFDRTVAQASRLTGTKLLSQQTAGQDVTGQIVDLKARVHALQATRSTYLTILGRATTIGQTLVVESHINDAQSQIEQLQGQLKLLADHAAMSTLTVDVDQPVTPAPVAKRGPPPAGFGHAVSLSIHRFTRGVDVIVGVIGPLLLALILLALVWVVGRVAVRRLRRHLV